MTLADQPPAAALVFQTHAFGAAADCDLVVRPLPFEEWARGAAAVAAQRLFAPALRGRPATPGPVRTGRGGSARTPVSSPTER